MDSIRNSKSDIPVPVAATVAGETSTVAEESSFDWTIEDGWSKKFGPTATAKLAFGAAGFEVPTIRKKFVI